jgi:excisionase family DNA binding protein
MKQKQLYSVKEASEILGVCIKTIHRWDESGKIKTIRTVGNQRRIPLEEIRRLLNEPEPHRAIIYGRVSSQKQKEDGNLDRQIKKLKNYAKDKNLEVVATIKEVASGINETRRGLRKALNLIRNGEADIILIEFTDRLARFGYKYLEKYIKDFKGEIVVVEQDKDKTPTEELVEDMLAIVASFGARLYGKRSQRFRKRVRKLAEAELNEQSS